jgi:hypothetical protein
MSGHYHAIVWIDHSRVRSRMTHLGQQRPIDCAKILKTARRLWSVSDPKTRPTKWHRYGRSACAPSGH